MPRPTDDSNAPMETLTLDVSALATLTDDALYELCVANREARMERTSEGNLIIQAPVGGEASARSARLQAALFNWNEQARTGIAFASNTGFLLPNAAMRSPGAGWLARERWERLSAEERRKFPPLCPDFVIELMSESDRLTVLQKKMEEWIENGCRLAWLIDPTRERAYVYRPGAAPQEVAFTEQLRGEEVLPGFVLRLEELR